MVDGSSAPIVLLDFDGVLNAFPDAIGVRYEDVGVAPVVECRRRMTDEFGPERAFRLDGVETVRLGRRGGTWHLHWSRELAANLYGLAESGAVDLRWLSTWQPYGTRTWCITRTGMIRSPAGAVWVASCTRSWTR